MASIKKGLGSQDIQEKKSNMGKLGKNLDTRH
jgi:hypothetical protein